MKILVLSTCYPTRNEPNYGVFIHRQVRALADLGVECHVIQPVDWSPPAPLHWLHAGWRRARSQRGLMLREVEGIPLHHPKVYHPQPSRFFPGDYWERVGKAVGRYVRLRMELRDADLLYAQFLCHEGYAGLLAAKQIGIPLVAIARGDDVHAWPERWPDRKPKLAAVLRWADGLLACSSGLARDAAKWATDGLSRPFEVIYNGIDCERFSPAGDDTERRAARRGFGLPEDKNLLLCVGTALASKGWLELLDALAALEGAAGVWDLVGAGVPRGGGEGIDLQMEARARGLDGRVHWLGRLSPTQMPALYRAVDAFVLASHNEGLSNSVVEAMASGLPVIATDVGGHAEVIADGENGWLVPPRDARALASAIRELFGDRLKGERMAAAARQAAIKVGDHKANALKLIQSFEAQLQKT